MRYSALSIGVGRFFYGWAPKACCFCCLLVIMQEITLFSCARNYGMLQHHSLPVSLLNIWSNLKVQKSKWLKQQLDVLLPSCKINVVNDCVKLFVDHSDVFWYISCCHKTLITATVLNTSMKMPIIHFFSVCTWLTILKGKYYFCSVRLVYLSWNIKLTRNNSSVQSQTLKH